MKFKWIKALAALLQNTSFWSISKNYTFYLTKYLDLPNPLSLSVLLTQPAVLLHTQTFIKLGVLVTPDIHILLFFLCLLKQEILDIQISLKLPSFDLAPGTEECYWETSKSQTFKFEPNEMTMQKDDPHTQAGVNY